MSIFLNEFQSINGNEIAECALSPAYNGANIFITSKKVLGLSVICFVITYLLFYNIIKSKHFLLRSQINDDDIIYK
jgi:hypothetical protein